MVVEKRYERPPSKQTSRNNVFPTVINIIFEIYSSSTEEKTATSILGNF